MIDDIISYGGSMYYSALTLKDLGAKNIYAFASHVENSILKGKLIQSNLIKKVYTTNSLFKGNHELIHVINI
jgi:ribose-phosphate pyrophosphokinase